MTTPWYDILPWFLELEKNQEQSRPSFISLPRTLSALQGCSRRRRERSRRRRLLCARLGSKLGLTPQVAHSASFSAASKTRCNELLYDDPRERRKCDGGSLNESTSGEDMMCSEWRWWKLWQSWQRLESATLETLGRTLNSLMAMIFNDYSALEGALGVSVGC